MIMSKLDEMQATLKRIEKNQDKLTASWSDKSADRTLDDDTEEPIKVSLV